MRPLSRDWIWIKHFPESLLFFIYTYLQPFPAFLQFREVIQTGLVTFVLWGRQFGVKGDSLPLKQWRVLGNHTHTGMPHGCHPFENTWPAKYYSLHQHNEIKRTCSPRQTAILPYIYKKILWRRGYAFLCYTTDNFFYFMYCTLQHSSVESATLRLSISAGVLGLVLKVDVIFFHCQQWVRWGQRRPLAQTIIAVIA